MQAKPQRSRPSGAQIKAHPEQRSRGTQSGNPAGPMWLGAKELESIAYSMVPPSADPATKHAAWTVKLAALSACCAGLVSNDTNISQRPMYRRRFDQAAVAIHGMSHRFVYEALTQYAWGHDKDASGKLLTLSPEAITRRCKQFVDHVALADPELAKQFDLRNVRSALEAFSGRGGRGKRSEQTREVTWRRLMAGTKLGVVTLRRARRN